MASNVMLPCCGHIVTPEFTHGERYVECPACGAPNAVKAILHDVVEYAARPTKPLDPG